MILALKNYIFFKLFQNYEWFKYVWKSSNVQACMYYMYPIHLCIYKSIVSSNAQ